MEGHPSDDLCRRFLLGEASSEECRRVVRHLIAGCPQCTEIVQWFAAGPDFWTESRPIQEEDYEEALQDEALQRAFALATAKDEPIAFEKPRRWVYWTTLETLSHNPALALFFLFLQPHSEPDLNSRR